MPVLVMYLFWLDTHSLKNLSACWTTIANLQNRYLFSLDFFSRLKMKLSIVKSIDDLMIGIIYYLSIHFRLSHSCFYTFLFSIYRLTLRRLLYCRRVFVFIIERYFWFYTDFVIFLSSSRYAAIGPCLWQIYADARQYSSRRTIPLVW